MIKKMTAPSGIINSRDPHVKDTNCTNAMWVLGAHCISGVPMKEVIHCHTMTKA
jgi:hypothetical protein